MKHYFMMLIVGLLCCSTAMANDKKAIEEVAKQFVIKDNSHDVSIKDILTDDFKYEEENKEKFLKRLERNKKEHERIIEALKTKASKLFLRKYYKNRPKMLEKVQEYSVKEARTAAEKIRNRYKTYDSDMEKTNASVKVTKIENKKDGLVAVSAEITPHINGKAEEKETYLIQLKKDSEKNWKVKELTEVEFEL